jgi:hypothetical protein
MAKAPADIRSLARSYTKTCIKTLVGIAAEPTAPAAARVSAAEALLNRGWGKPAQPLTGEDGGPILIQTLLESLDGRARGLPR